MDSLSEARLDLVNPLLAGKVRQMASILQGEGIIFKVTQGMRTWAEQRGLYEQGRTRPGKVITNAPPGHSWHNFGLAVDLVPDDPTIAGFQCVWDISHPVWKRLVAVGESLGLVAGATWRTFPDWPHFQLTGRFPVSPDDEVRHIFMDRGVATVWNEAFR